MVLSRRNLLLSSLVLPAVAQKKPTAQPPNILLILAQGLPAWAVGIYGNKEIRTPHIDRLSQMGTRFTNHYAAAPAPGVNRAALLSGRTPMQLGEGENPATGESGLDKLLAAKGYSYHSTDVTGAMGFLDAPPAGKPFFLVVNLKPLHAPYDGVAQKYHDLYGKTRFDTLHPERAAANAVQGQDMLADPVAGLRKAAAAISALDDDVQMLTAKILARKLLDGTLILFTSTSGDLLSHHGLWGAGEASDPVNMYEESMRTPMIWVWPGQVPAQLARPELVSAYDFVPTLCEAVSVDPPARNLCGRSYLLLATGKPLPKNEPWRTTVFAQYRNTGMARVQRYKLVLRESGNGRSELYGLVADPAEKVNQYDTPEFVTVRNSLTAELTAWKQKCAS